MMKRIDKRKLTEAIYNRLGGAISKSSIYDALGVINDSMVDMIVDNKTISVHNFGTLSPYVFHGHKGLNINSGHLQEVKEFKTVKFRAHHTLMLLLEQKKDKFRKP